MKLKLCILIMLTAGPGLFRTVSAQARPKDSGSVTVIQDARIDELIRKQILINESVPDQEGYRIQIFTDSGSSSKTRAQAALDEFTAKHPEARAYLVFKSPNYKVKVGDFRTRLDAVRYLGQISADYPNAFIIQDLISTSQIEP